MYNTSSAQQIFRTVEGRIGARGMANDTILIAGSYELVAVINYTNAEILLKLDPKTIWTQIFQIDSLLHTARELIILKGKLNMDFINTLGHPVEQLGFEAELTLNGVKRKIQVKGVLRHVSDGGNVACNLSLNFQIHLSEFKIENLPFKIKDAVYVEVSQAVLKKD